MNRKGFAPLIILLIVIGVMIVGAAVFFYWRQTVQPPPQPKPQQRAACTQEAKRCPDGSYVSRQGPNCEFAVCPNPPVPAQQAAHPKMLSIIPGRGTLLNQYTIRGEGFDRVPLTNKVIFMVPGTAVAVDATSPDGKTIVVTPCPDLTIGSCLALQNKADALINVYVSRNSDQYTSNSVLFKLTNGTDVPSP